MVESASLERTYVRNGIEGSNPSSSALKKNYKFKSKVVIWAGEQGAWHFAYVPKLQSAEIKKNFDKFKRGWGSFRVIAKVGRTEWLTSIFPDSRSGAYVLPIKASVRKAEGIFETDTITVEIKIQI